jgi:hypothetical protein
MRKGPRLRYSEAEMLERSLRKSSSMMGSQVAVEQQSIKTIDNTDAGCDGKRALHGWPVA